MRYVFLELDTTAPQIIIHAPSYTTRSALTPITIQANEQLSSYQEIYLTDSEGERHDLTFDHKGDYLEGSLYLTNLPIGMTTIHVRLKDEVNNISSLYQQSFNILASEILTSELQVITMKNKTTFLTMKQELTIKTMQQKVSTKTMLNELSAKTMRNEMEVVS